MKYERWLIPETDDAAVEALMDAGYPYLVSTVLASRGSAYAQTADITAVRTDSARRAQQALSLYSVMASAKRNA